jgi:hypothetical protein
MRGVWCGLLGLVALGVLAGCKSTWFEAREPWRREAEEQCLKTGSVKESPAIAMLKPIQGPGMCGADYPLKVVALGENEAMGYAQDLRPPGAVPQAALPSPPPAMSYPSRGVTSPPLSSPSGSSGGYPTTSQPYYPRPSYDAIAAPSAPPRSAPMSLDPPGGGPNSPTYYPPIEREPIDAPRMDGGYQPSYERRPYEAPRSNYGSHDSIMREPAQDHYRRAPGPRDDDYRDEDYPRARQPYPHPQQRGPANRASDAPLTTAPAQSPRMSPIPLGPARRPIQTTAAVSPAATLACPIVSALDAWIKDAVQPAANRWFNQPVVEIKQISAYSCRGMNGQPGARISEHAFGNALDIASFVLADGRKVSVQHGWRGTPEEQGFLRDIQAAACEQFSTVLAPGSNAFHYDHIHVDLMRRSSGRRICQPGAVSGEEVAARATRNRTALARQQDRSGQHDRYDRQDRYQRAPRNDLIEPESDPFAWRGARDGMPTGSVSNATHGKHARPPRRAEPVDDEHILFED